LEGPKNLAVFHILVILSPSGERMKERFHHPLAQQAREYFQRIKNQSVAKTIDKFLK